MALKIGDRIKETASSSGLADFTLAGAVTGMQPFSAMPGGWTSGDTTWYCAVNSGEWEIGLGTCGASASALGRTTILASSAGGTTRVNFSAPPTVFCTVPASQTNTLSTPREFLTADRTYYVRPDGNDSNSGLADTAAGAFLTIQAAVTKATSVNAGSFQVTVKIADGTYAESVVAPPMLGSKPLIIRGNNATPANVLVNSSGVAFSVGSFTLAGPPAAVQILDMKLQASSICLNAGPLGSMEFGNVIFGTAGTRHIAVAFQAYVNAVGDYTISGGAQFHIQANNGGRVRVSARTITLTGTPAFSVAFVQAYNTGFVYIGGNTFSGAATGVRYNVTLNGVIDSNGGGASALPGNSVGTTATGGQYN